MPVRPPQKKIIIFTRYPVPGQTKTRLVPALGHAGAAALQKKMTEHTVAIARQCCQSDGRRLEIRYTGADHESMRAWLGDFELAQQGDGDLGDRLVRSFTAAFQAGVQQVVITGSDCPELTPQLLDRAFELLAETDLVLGPATDGGYYLIGLSRQRPELFHDIPWGTAEVLTRTLARAQFVGCGHALLPPLADVDRPADLRPFSLLSLPD